MESLVQLAKLGDADAIEEILRKLGGLIYKTIQRIQPYAEDRENLVGEAHLILLRAIDAFDESYRVPFKLFYQKQLNYFLLDDLKQKVRYESYPIEDHLDLASEDDIEAAFLSEEKAQELARFIATLSPREQAVVTLFYRENLSLSEIAQYWGASYQTVANTKTRAIKKLRRLYDSK